MREHLWTLPDILELSEEDLADVPSQIIDEALGNAERVLDLPRGDIRDESVAFWLAVAGFLDAEWNRY